MTYGGPGALSSDTVAAGPEVGGPAGVPDAAPAPHHHPALPAAAYSERTASGYRQRPGGAPPHPARRAGNRAREVPMA